jgi:hypothetical protein
MRQGRKVTKEIKLEELKPDNLNANKGTPRGAGMIEHSLREFGAGRSILVDKNGRIIAGNKTAEAAGSIGLDDAVLVESDGRRLVVVKRTDIDLDSPQGRALAVADNRTSEVGLDWDRESLAWLSDQIDLGQFWFDDELDALELPNVVDLVLGASPTDEGAAGTEGARGDAMSCPHCGELLPSG